MRIKKKNSFLFIIFLEDVFFTTRKFYFLIVIYSLIFPYIRLSHLELSHISNSLKLKTRNLSLSKISGSLSQIGGCSKSVGGFCLKLVRLSLFHLSISQLSGGDFSGYMWWHTLMVGLWLMIFVDLGFHLVKIQVGEEGLRFDQGDFLIERV